MKGFSYDNNSPYPQVKYSSKVLDEEANQSKYHYGWRDYYPELGRWLAPDPLREFASPYVFVGNNPINGFDPDGRKQQGAIEPYLIWDYLNALNRELEYGRWRDMIEFDSGGSSWTRTYTITEERTDSEKNIY